MTVEIGGVQLSDSLQWANRYQSKPMAQAFRRSLAGGLAHNTKSLTEGRSIELEATNQTGWFTKSMVDQLVNLAASPDATYSFNFHGESYVVKFDHREGPAVEFNPIRYKQVQSQDDWFTGTVRLFTV